MNPLTIVELAQSPLFQTGLVVGLVAMAASVASRPLRRHYGLVWFTAVVVAATMAGLVRYSAFEMAMSPHAWVVPVGAIGVAMGAWGLARAPGRRQGLSLMATVAGIWATVPDTERISLALGITIVMVWVLWPDGFARLGLPGAVAVAIVLAWTIVIGGTGRGASLVGGFGVLGAAAWLGAASRVTLRRVAVDVVVYMLLVLVWSRLAGAASSPLWAAAIGLSLTAGVLGVRLAVFYSGPGAGHAPDRASGRIAR